MTMGFKNDFVWGAATAAYQIEGAAYKDGKGLSVWDVFCKEEGNIKEGHNGDIACDHYHMMKEDVKRMADLGLKAYRFSIAWTRILPDGMGQVNEAGLRFYSDLVDELLAHGITPYLTLFHWDLPYELHKKGGWLSDESPKWFEYYTSVVARALGDRVKHFITFNEPQVFVGVGYKLGFHAPGEKQGKISLMTIAFNVMLAHGLSVKKLREQVDGVRVGYAPTCGAGFYPVSEDPADIEAAKKASRFAENEHYIMGTAFWNEPILKGIYRDEWRKVLGEETPALTQDQLKIIHQPLDFLGMNVYQGIPVRAAEGVSGFAQVPFKVGHSKTGMGWPVTPPCIYWTTRIMYEEFGLPIIITENGISCLDVVSLDGKVHDPGRIDYLHRYLLNLKRAADEGIPVEGYFQWSFMDNFEWSNGYGDRFGLVYVDYENKERINKDSFYWYKEVIASNGSVL